MERLIAIGLWSAAWVLQPRGLYWLPDAHAVI